MARRETPRGVKPTDRPHKPGLERGLTLAVFRNLGKNHYSLVHVFSRREGPGSGRSERPFTPPGENAGWAGWTGAPTARHRHIYSGIAVFSLRTSATTRYDLT